MKPVKQYYRKIEGRVVTFIRQLIGREPRNRVEVQCRKELIGNWVVYPDGLSAQSLIISLGIGGDIRFDEEIISRYSCAVHAFDPTPRWVEWIREQNLPPEFHFHPFAVSGKDSVMKLYPRLSKGKRSETMMTLFDESNACEAGVEVGVKRLSTILNELGYNRIDILKMDIEGAEYDVIQDVLVSDVAINQIIVEFHHRFRTFSVDMTIMALKKLHDAGYRIFHISDKCKEYSLIHETAIYHPSDNA